LPMARIACCFSTNDCVHCKKSDHFQSQIHQESPFLNAQLARRTLSAVSFSLQTSTMRAIHAYGNDCFLC
jgi:hypothetical protein